MLRKLIIISHNVQHWKTRRDNLINCYMEFNPDVIILNSHGLKSEETLKIKGYNIFKINSSEEINDGSAIAVKENIKYKIYDDYITDLIAIEILTETGPIIIGTTYIPPRRLFFPYPDIHKLSTNNTPTYLIGDLNAKHRILGDSRNNTVGKGIVRLINEGKLEHLGPNFPTLIRQTGATTPDIILGNRKTYHYMNTKVGPATTSDHLPIIITLSTKPIQMPCNPRYNYKEANWEQYKEKVSNKLQEERNIEEATLEEIDEELDRWYTAVEEGMESAIPKTTRTSNHRRYNSQELTNIQQEFKALWRQGTGTGWTNVIYARYKQLRTRIQEECKRLKTEQWNKTLQEININLHDPKIFWERINQIRASPSQTTQYMINIHGNKVYTNNEKEKIFREHWEKIYNITDEDNEEFDEDHERRVLQELNERMHRTIPYNAADPTRLQENNTLTRKITEYEITNTIKSMKNNAPGESGIKKPALENLPPIAIKTLQNILNAALSAGYFPDRLKKAMIKFIPKEGKELTQPTGYRPISLLETPSKIFEKILNKRFRNYAEQHGLFHKDQYGFRPNRGTNTAIALAYEQIATALGEKQQCHVVLRDVAKAFDRVWHQGLKYKITDLGLPTIYEKILCDFLDDRTATIQLDGYKGPSFELNCGVPQGSSLSPTLYIIYIRDLPQPGPGCMNIHYADDISQIITYPGKSRNMMARRAEREISQINNYEHKWKIKTNINKFKIIAMAQKKIEDIMVDNERIEYKREGTILGQRITATGIIAHTNYRKQRAKESLTKLKIFRQLSRTTKIQLIKSLVIPLLQYPPVPLHTISKTQQLYLQRIQNKAIRWATNDERHPYQKTTEQLHTETGIQPLNTATFNQAVRTWESFAIINPELFDILKEHESEREHGWYPRSITILDEDEPQPLYVR